MLAIPKLCILFTSALLLISFPLNAASPTAKQALELEPIQREIDYDTPNLEEVKKCKINSANTGSNTGWVVRDSNGKTLRRFIDTNGDNKVDLWCYFKDSVEIYRDIDSNFNGKADQFRWLGTAGTRWGIDRNEDGNVDFWKSISAEEVSVELIHALRNKDAEQFSRLLLNSAELSQLELGTALAAKLRKKAAAANKDFASIADKQTIVTLQTKWLHFGGGLPGLIPAGTDDSGQDIQVYDNVVAVVETGTKHAQIVIGSLIQLDTGWRLIDLPSGLLEDQVVSHPTGIFFQASIPSNPEIPENSPPGIDEETQQLIGELDRLEREISAGPSSEKSSELFEQRATTLEKLAFQASSPENQVMWIRQFADSVSGSVTSGDFPEGLKQMQLFEQKLIARNGQVNEIAYVRFRAMSAEYSQSLQAADADFVKIQEAWMANLESFIEKHEETSDAAEAMLQLAIAKEFSGEENEAIQWYGRIATNHTENELSPKAIGAKRRLESVGKTIELKGTTVEGKSFNLTNLQGQVVLIHYWATWCRPCKQDAIIIKQMQAKYGKRGFSPVGVNLDTELTLTKTHLQANRMSWPQLFEAGGLDGRLANELGILTLPTMLLIDKNGRVLNRNIHAAELEDELAKLLL